MTDLAEVLGVSDVSASGENSGEVVTPATETENQESQTDTAGESDTPEGIENAADSQTEEGTQEDGTPVQTPEQNAKWAELRREADRAKVLETQLQTAQQSRDQFYAQRFGKSHGIYTEAQYQVAIDRTHQEQAQEQTQQQVQQQALQPLQQAWAETQQLAARMKEEGYGDTYVNAYVEQQRKLIQQEDRQIRLEQRIQQDDNRRLQAQTQAEQRQQQQQVIQTIQKRIEDDHAALIAKYGDAVQPLKQLASDPEILRLTGLGYSLKSAWIEANEDNVSSKKAAAVKQAALNSVNSKQHLKPDGGKGSGDVDTTTVPADVMAQFRALNKGASEEEFVKFYKKNNPKRR